MFETTISFEQLETFRKQYVLLSEKLDQKEMIVRFVHKGETEVDWIPVVSHLEDVFLYEYRDDLQMNG